MNGISPSSSPPLAPSNQEDQVAKLQVSESTVSTQATPAEPSSHMTRHAMTDDISTGSESSDENNEDNVPRQELELVINALQTTVLKSTPPPEEAPSSTRDRDGSHHSADELHSGDEFHESSSSTSSEYDYSTQQQQQQQQQHSGIKSDEIVPPTPGSPPPNFEPPVRLSTEEDMPDVESFSANLIALHDINLKEVKANNSSPREQERKDEPVLRAMRHLFNNRFMKAKRLFEREAKTDPLHALGLGSMAFLKAVMTADNEATDRAIDVLMVTYSLATAQIDAATKKNVGDSVVQYFTSYYNHIKYSRTNGLPASPKPATPQAIKKQKITFVPNGILRAHVAKAECCLQIAILQLLQESVVGYIKCGLNLRRAYTSYSLVWQEYKRMGQSFNDFIDQDTVSGIQFGIGTVHLVLSSLPQKVLRVVSAFGWKADKHLGFALLKLCLEGRRIRSPTASLMLLAYYTVLTSLCPQILTSEYTQPAIETLLDAQRTYPNSAFFLYFAGRTSRLARNLILSTQSFMYAIEISKNEWAEVEVLHLCSYEIGFNYMMQHNWGGAAKIFENLYKERYWSPAIFRYLHGACLDMMGERTDAILAFAEVPELVNGKTPSSSSSSSSSTAAMMERYVLRKVNAYQATGYQDMDMNLCALEYLCIFNAFDFMDTALLERSLAVADGALNRILEAERMEYGIRTRELLPETPPPQYYDQRGTLLLIKASLQNAMGHYRDAIIHLNWIIDHKDKIASDKWVVPFAFWQAGVTSWGLDYKTRARSFWETASKYTKFDFEYRLAMTINLAITRADELNVPKPEQRKSKLAGKTDAPREQQQPPPPQSSSSDTTTPTTPIEEVAATTSVCPTADETKESSKSAD
ncbi:hypothetical protein BDB00DRAFT_802371 [Zychaea mexicana]|uniref:uncharacterized protein n=1 Tax=Zychaea mexicana TaxID=64656 RepID=UPI0022FEC973|nr:uncharacterized protein BDB00DRAFT_802371 [Zychaea mexicana]KAI9497886.1 hypothetical protein BDB00DRAFT_802371 [Zychaea mexicana]